MPTHKGIKISLVSQWELKVHPEFPHPDTSQFTYRSPDLRKGDHITQESWPKPSPTFDSKADRLLGRQTAVSVYTPSLSGARFWIRYVITEEAVRLSQWYYFKLCMNGRHVTSWGTNAQAKPSGQVMRGLFEPSDRWYYKNNGVVYKNMGTESRPFFFGNEEEAKSAATDGGLIEIRVYRSHGRRRKLASPEDFKSQESYGIIMPSGGLLERPQDAKFFDWHLKDPTDAPFAIFKFHYRSWESLYSLSLIPADHPRQLIPQLPIAICQGDHGSGHQAGSKDFSTSRDLSIAAEALAISDDNLSCESFVSEVSNTPWLTDVFGDDKESCIAGQTQRGLQYSTYSIDTDPRKREVDITLHEVKQYRPNPPISRFSSTVASRPTTPETACPLTCQHILDRPLPKIPERTLSNYQDGHSRNSSAASNAISITPSLLEILDRDIGSPEAFVGTAIAMPLPRMASVSDLVEIEDISVISSADRSFTLESECTQPIIRATLAKHQAVVMGSSGLNDVFVEPDLTNITIRKRKRSLIKGLPKLAIPSPSMLRDDSDIVLDIKEETPPALNDMSTLTLSPAEWMCRTPSPVRKDPYFRMWSPSPREARKSRDLTEAMYSPTPAGGKRIQLKDTQAVSLRKKSMECYDQDQEPKLMEGPAHDTSVTAEAFADEDDEDRVRTGWI